MFVKSKHVCAEPYCSHITSITGMEIVADKLGLVRKTESGELESVAAAQVDHDHDGVPSAAPNAKPHAAVDTQAGVKGYNPPKAGSEGDAGEEKGGKEGGHTSNKHHDPVQGAMAGAASDARRHADQA